MCTQERDGLIQVTLHPGTIINTSGAKRSRKLGECGKIFSFLGGLAVEKVEATLILVPGSLQNTTREFSRTSSAESVRSLEERGRFPHYA
jgi:hypothetical protein